MPATPAMFRQPLGSAVRAVVHKTELRATQTSISSRGLRSFSSKTAALNSNGKSDDYGKEHVVDRQEKERLDPQAKNSADAINEKMHDSHAGESQATTQRDHRNSTERTKKEHPEAPDVVIGMQDERGHKGR